MTSRAIHVRRFVPDEPGRLGAFFSRKIAPRPDVFQISIHTPIDTGGASIHNGFFIVDKARNKMEYLQFRPEDLPSGSWVDVSISHTLSQEDAEKILTNASTINKAHHDLVLLLNSRLNSL